ncbi:tail fiber domain-containing protein [Cnuella takakiae]|nr:tail fiber domain-containing protein [Cnuella takakiae]
MKTTLNALAVLLSAALLGVNPVHAQGVLGQMLRNNLGGRLRAVLDNPAGTTGQYTATFPAASGTLLLNEAGIVNFRTTATATEQRFWNSTGTFYTGLRAGAATANTTFTLPVADGAAGQLLQTNGGGQLQWFTPSADWTINGNNGTNPTSNFIGTTDNVSLAFRTANTQRMVITNAGRVGIGVAAPANNLVVLDNIEVQRGASTSVSSLTFSNTANQGDFRIGGDGGDIFWQGGGGRNLQMGAFHGMVLAGDRQANTALNFLTPSSTTGTINTNVLVQSQRSGSVPLAIQGFSGSSANLTEWRTPGTNALMNVVNSNGNLGLGNTNPVEKLDITGNLKLTGALMPGGAAGSAGQVLISSGPGAAPTWLSVNNSNVWVHGGNTLAAQQNFGTLSNHDLPFITNTSERMRLTTAGFLGINTSTPLEALDVNGNIRISGGNKRLVFLTPGDDPDGVIEMRKYGTAAENSEMLFFSGNDPAGSWGPDRIRMATNEFKIQTTTSAQINTIALAEAENTENTRLLINSAGNVGIGTEQFDGTAPEKLLVDAGTTSSYNLINGQGSINGYLQFNIQNNSTGNLSSTDIVATANNGNESTNYIDMGINGQNYTGNYFGSANDAYLYNLGNDLLIGAGSTNKSVRFLTGGGNKATNTRMIIDGSGNVGIGTLNPIDKLTVAGNIYPTADNTYNLGRVGNRWQTVFAYNWSSPSDLRLKTNIQSLSYGLNEVLALRPVQYNWNVNPNKDIKLGLIAQEVQKVVPEVVEGNQEKEMLSMDYTELIPVLINAIKEQQTQIDDLKKEISKLKKNKQ